MTTFNETIRDRDLIITYMTRYIAFIGMLLISTPPVFSADIFSGGEKLVFDLSWFGMSGGTTVMEVKDETEKDIPVYKVTSTTRSNKIISVFYPVHDVVESSMDKVHLYPYRFRSRQNEGSYQSDKEIIFDRRNKLAVSINHKKEGDELISEIPGMVQDPLSVVYYYRTLPIEIGKDTFIDVFDGKKNWTLVIKSLKRENIWTPAGTFDTIKVKAMIKYEGLFVNKGDVFVWFTDDERHTPVMMVSKIKIGNITAMLIEKEDPGLMPHPASGRNLQE